MAFRQRRPEILFGDRGILGFGDHSIFLRRRRQMILAGETMGSFCRRPSERELSW